VIGVLRRLALACAFVCACARASAAVEADANAYAIGDRIAAAGLVDQHARSFTFAQLAPHAVALAFVTTHCRTGRCSLVAGKFAHLLASADARRERLVLVAIDPAADTPAALARYGRLFDSDDRITFVTGNPQTIRTLARRLGVSVGGGTVDTHGETVAILDGDGRIADLLAGFDWSPAMLQTALDAVARIAYNPVLRAIVHLTWSTERLCGEHSADEPLALHHAGLLAFAIVPLPLFGLALVRGARRRPGARES
jgi:cytochrome oxidase Cu insertion factor (SCO1/SenC/PrrC family)